MLFLEGESNHPSVLLHLQQEGGEKNSSVTFLCGRSPRVGTYLSSYPERKKERKEKEKEKERENERKKERERERGEETERKTE